MPSKVRSSCVVVVFCIVFTCYWVSWDNKFSRLNHSSTNSTSIYLNVRFSIDHHQKNPIELERFNGEYEEVPELYQSSAVIHSYRLDQIFFVLTTNTQRILDTIHELKFWSHKSGIRCSIVFEERDLKLNSPMRDFLDRHRIPCEIQSSNIKRFENRYFQLIEIAWSLIQHRSLSIQWLAIGDDDTLWFIDNLLFQLQQYNASKMIYLGNISDRQQSINTHGDYFVYGGGGILLSHTLVLNLLPWIDQCQQNYSTLFGGDEMIGRCITEYLHLSLTQNSHFHQIDHQGDLRGYLQSGISGLVSLHHMFAYWEPFPVRHTSDESQTMSLLSLGDQSFRQRFFKRYRKVNWKTNETYLLTLGYSFSVFYQILTFDDLFKVEQTWCCSNVTRRAFRAKQFRSTHWYFANASRTTTTRGIQSIYRNRRKDCFPSYSSVEIFSN